MTKTFAIYALANYYKFQIKEFYFNYRNYYILPGQLFQNKRQP